MSDQPPTSHPDLGILSGLPRTDPEVLRQMEANRAAWRHYSAIGAVAAVWSNFEATVDREALELAGIDVDIGTCFTAQIAGSARKLDAYISLARLLRDLPEKLIRDLEKFSKQTVTLSERRNRVVHDVWYFDHPNPPERHEASARRILQRRLVPTTTEELRAFVGTIDDHRKAFEEFASAVKTSPTPPPASPEREPELPGA